MRIERFATAYLKETGREPDRLFYIVNAQFAVPPVLRARPSAGAPDLAEEFAKAGGVVIATADLYRLHRDLGAIGQESARAALAGPLGVFKYPADLEIA